MNAPANRIPDQLICPACATRLTVSEETVQCQACAASYPVVAGIPRFVEQEHLASFGFQWNRYEVAHADEDRETFRVKTGMSAESLAGLRVLDAGCGGGRYCRIAAEAGAVVTAADHSAAVEKASRLCDQLESVKLVQADLKHLPFPGESFDFAFSIGVMHHDVDTRAVFNAVARMVRPGGQMAVWLYRRNTWWQEALNQFLRRRTTNMSARRLEPWCRLGAILGGIPLVKQMLSKVVNFSTHPVRENRICDTFDWYAPEYQHHHTTAELCDWFREAGFEECQVLLPEKTGTVYRWAWRHNLIIGSGVNVLARRKQ